MAAQGRRRSVRGGRTNYEDSQKQPEAETQVRLDGGSLADGTALSGRGVRSALGRTAAEALEAEAVTAALRQHVRDCPVGTVVTTGPEGLVRYASASFRTLARAEDGPVSGRPFFEAFPLLGLSEPVRTFVNASLTLGCAPAAEIPVTVEMPDDTAARLVLGIESVSVDGNGGTGATGSQAVLFQLRQPSDRPATVAAETRARAGAGARRKRRGERRAMDSELLEVNQRLVVAALREQELKERAEEASKAKSAFLATMSHELRTPLNAIIGYASLLDEQVWGPIQPEQHTHLNRLKLSARHLLGLINDVLTLARVEADKEIVSFEEVSAGSVLDEALALTIPLAMAKRIACSVLPFEDFVFRTDRGKLVQILVNLLGNAVKFTDAGAISLSGAIHGDVAEFSVTDTGIGIAPQHLAHVFELFWQADQDLTRRVGGSGMGLNVSRRLAWLLGGRLRVESVPGTGSTFTVCLPLSQLREADAT